MLFQGFLDALASPAALGHLLQHSTQQTTREWAPRNQTQPMGLTRRDNFELNHARV